ncbi:hypothetical protein GOODEAATRI_023018 [Goodea atripinnis]|uniref:Uncharacterized protein n=1 Tax=Goodea atripinnis TaxID=208336 RepID=A0ABV0Q0C2_9TELE
MPELSAVPNTCFIILDSSVPGAMIQKSWSLTTLSLANLSLSHADENSTSAVSVSVLQPWTFTLTAARACCRSHYDTLGYLETSFSILRSALGKSSLAGHAGNCFECPPLEDYLSIW